MITDYYNVTTEAAEDPITLSEARDWLRMRSTADDVIIATLIQTVAEIGEKFTGRLFIQRTIEGFFGGLEASRFETVPFITLRRAPLLDVSTVEVYSNGAYTAFTDYTLKRTSTYSRLLFFNGLSDTIPDSDIAYPVKVTFTAGYGESTDIPVALKAAMKAHLAFLYDNRGDVIAEGALGMPLETKAIYSGKYRILNTFG